MAERNPPGFLQARTDHDAELFRRATHAWASGSATSRGAGILNPPSSGNLSQLMQLTATGPASMAVNVAPGEALVPGTSSVANQGLYYVYNDAPTTVPITASSSSYFRNDAIIAAVEDSAYSGSSDDWHLLAIPGTPNGFPLNTSYPANYLLLGYVKVRQSTGSILQTDIFQSQGAEATGRGGIARCSSAARPPSPAVGQPIFETDTKIMKWWSGTHWQRVGPYPRHIDTQVGGPPEPSPWVSPDTLGLWYKVNDPAGGGNNLLQVVYDKECGNETILRYEVQGTMYFTEGPPSPGTNYSCHFGTDRNTAIDPSNGEQMTAPGTGFSRFRVDHLWYSPFNLAPGSYTCTLIVQMVTSNTKVVFGSQDWLQYSVEEVPVNLL